ncbi:hypothetical protein EHP00_865 [Ecytonucleospora hepatopenaei]|uniref:Uncharacterized protein n=1 Tax=Ecytonucleospora hepatopenaei TaxID=646526 RepID=A0A1W0E3Y9_9MICR|nr:hypothetical protein EHP00_865 [Ecytonucleospora hepatopenaei]
MLFNIFYNFIIFNILSIKANNIIEIENDTTVTLLNKNSVFSIKYTIKEQKEITNEGKYYFYVKENDKKRIFKVERKFGLEKNTTVVYKGKCYKICDNNTFISNKNNIEYIFLPFSYPKSDYELCIDLGISCYKSFLDLNLSDNKKEDCLEQPIEPPFKYNTCKVNKQSKKVDKNILITDIKLNERKPSKKVGRNFNHSQVFVLNKENFKKFIKDKSYSFGKQYLPTIHAVFLGKDAKIVLNNCKLEEISNINTDHTRFDFNNLKEKPSLNNDKKEDNLDNEFDLDSLFYEDNLNNDKKEDNLDNEFDLDSLFYEDNLNNDKNEDDLNKDD